MNAPDEINLGDLIFTIWRGKLTVFATVVVFWLIAGLYILLYPKSINAELPLLPMPAEQMIAYQPYNASASIPIDSEVLFSHFIDSLKYREVIYKAAKNTELFSDKKFKSRDELDFEYRRFANRVELREAEPKKQTFFKTLVFDVPNREKAYFFSAELIKLTNTEIQRVISSLIKNEIDIALQSRQFQIVDLQSEINSLKEEFQYAVDRRIAFLLEQVVIARSLGLQNPALNQIERSDWFLDAEQSVGSSSYYLRGYKAIETEIELMKSRRASAMHIPQVDEIYSKIRRLQNIDDLERRRELLLASPMKTGNFKATATTTYNLEFENNNVSAIGALAIATILGSFFGAFLVMLLKVWDDRIASLKMYDEK